MSTSTTTKWFTLTPEQALTDLESSPEGLSSHQAEERILLHGPNELPAKKSENPIISFFKHFNDVLIYVLLAAALGTALLGHWVDTWIILAVVVINALVGYIQEGKAAKALEAVSGMLSKESRVLRDGQEHHLPSREIAPGDVVVLRSGDRVPADLRLIKTHELLMDESSLTGESEAVHKTPEPVQSDTSLADRTCMAYMGTLVQSGEAYGLAAERGEATELGKINTMIAGVEDLKTPLIQKVNKFALKLSAVVLGTAAVTFILGYFLMGIFLEELFLSVVGIAVAAIPEGLPAVISITLALGVQRMAGKKALIRRLPGVETLGSVQVICTDKTGTLTKSEMTVTKVILGHADYEVTGTGYSPEGEISSVPEDEQALDLLLTAGSVCNTSRLMQKDGAWTIEGSPTEAALLPLAEKAGRSWSDLRKQADIQDSIPFESEHKFMAALTSDNQIFMVGAPDIILPRCSQQTAKTGGSQGIDQGFWASRAEELASQGYRLLGIARKSTEPLSDLTMDNVKSGMELIGLTAIIDPPRAEAVESVKTCRQAGIRVVMITGDHALTARAIAQKIGIGHPDSDQDETLKVVSGTEIEVMDDQELKSTVMHCSVYARVSPEHKLRLVQALQDQGFVTAMTGDGVNDAPALKKADMGIAMGIKGTEAAKEAAEMVLADDNFATIAHAVQEGRRVYDNIKKTISFLLPTNGGEGLVIIIAIFLGLTMPMTPVQVLWVNMVTAVTLALALAFEPMEEGLMKRPPRPGREPLITPGLFLRILLISLVLSGATLGIFMISQGQADSIELSRTLAINTIIMGEIMYLFSSRYRTRGSISLAGLKATPQVWGTVGLVMLLQMPFTYWQPMQAIFGTTAMKLTHWLIILAVGIGILILAELEKFLTRRLVGE